MYVLIDNTNMNFNERKRVINEIKLILYIMLIKIQLIFFINSLLFLFLFF